MLWYTTNYNVDLPSSCSACSMIERLAHNVPLALRIGTQIITKSTQKLIAAATAGWNLLTRAVALILRLVGVDVDVNH